MSDDDSDFAGFTGENDDHMEEEEEEEEEQEQQGGKRHKVNGKGKKNDDVSDDEDDDDDDEDDDDDDDDDDNDEEEEEEDEKVKTKKKKGFSDDNRLWLKRKLAGEDVDDVDDDDDDDDDEDEELPIEKEARQADLEAKRMEEDAQAERESDAQRQGAFRLPTEAEAEKEKLAPPDMTRIQNRIQDVLFVLADFRKRREADRARSDYIDRLRDDMSNFFGYVPELIEMFLEMFSPAEAMELLEANEAPRPVTIRTNTLKTKRRELAQSLTKRGVHLDTVGDWSKVGLKIYESQVPIGATPEYLAGHYMLQSASSFLPVMALAPVENEFVVDMCASPGGKSTYLASLMKNTGTLVCNDFNRKRLPSLIGNLHRLGVRNAIVSNEDGRKLPHRFSKVDRVLLDAPCSGMGVIARDPSIKLQRSVKDIQRSSHLQKELLLAAIDMVDAHSKTGGYIVYSTCSITLFENEEVADYVLSKRYVKLVSTNLPFGVNGYTKYGRKRFHPSLKLTKRYYPHVHNMDGFYVARFKKYANGVKKQEPEEEDDDDEEEDEEEEDGDDSDSDLDGAAADNDDADDDDDDDDDEGEEEEEEEEEEEKKETKTKKKKKKQKSQNSPTAVEKEKDDTRKKKKKIKKKNKERETTNAAEHEGSGETMKTKKTANKKSKEKAAKKSSEKKKESRAKGDDAVKSKKQAASAKSKKRKSSSGVAATSTGRTRKSNEEPPQKAKKKRKFLARARKKRPCPPGPDALTE